jgi:YbbR domain-containing protein
MFLLSLVIATLAWFGIRALNGFSTLVTDIPVSIQPPAGWIVLDAGVKTVDISFLGTRESQRFLSRDLVKVSVDLRDHTDTAPVRHVFRPADVNAMGAATVDTIRPDSVTVRMDRQITKQVPVRMETQNMLPDGYEQQAPVVTPATVQLTGPESQLRLVESVSTQPVDLDGRIRTFTRRGQRLVLPGGPGSLVRADPAAVTLEIPIVERFSTLQFDACPVEILAPPDGEFRAGLLPDDASVTVKGPPEIVKTLTAAEIRLFVEATGAEGHTPVSRTIQAHLPEKISLVRIDPPQAKLQLTYPEAPPPPAP